MVLPSEFPLPTLAALPVSLTPPQTLLRACLGHACGMAFTQWLLPIELGARCGCMTASWEGLESSEAVSSGKSLTSTFLHDVECRLCQGSLTHCCDSVLCCSTGWAAERGWCGPGPQLLCRQLAASALLRVFLHPELCPEPGQHPALAGVAFLAVPQV